MAAWGAGGHGTYRLSPNTKDSPAIPRPHCTSVQMGISSGKKGTVYAPNAPHFLYPSQGYGSPHTDTSPLSVRGRLRLDPSQSFYRESGQRILSDRGSAPLLFEGVHGFRRRSARRRTHRFHYFRFSISHGLRNYSLSLGRSPKSYLRQGVTNLFSLQ